MAIERKLSPTHEAPYRGLRVLDFGQGIASPYCAMLLGVYGAEIIKVEPPEGDWSRYLGTTYGNHTTLSAVYNRGKRSLCLDMKHAEGVAIARRIGELLRQLRGTGTTVLIAEQNMHFCLGLASHATVIDKGQIVYTSGIEELKANENIRQRYLAL